MIIESVNLFNCGTCLGPRQFQNESIHPFQTELSLSSFTSCFEPETLAISKFLPWAGQTGIWRERCVSHLLTCPFKTSHAWSFVLFALLQWPWKAHGEGATDLSIGSPWIRAWVAYPWSGALTPDNKWQWNGIWATGFGIWGFVYYSSWCYLN